MKYGLMALEVKESNIKHELRFQQLKQMKLNDKLDNNIETLIQALQQRLSSVTECIVLIKENM